MRISQSFIFFLSIILLSPFGPIAQPASQGVDDWTEEIERLRAIPYVDLCETSVTDHASGVVLFERGKAWPGYNLYCTRFTGEAFLMDMDGEVVHHWRFLRTEEGGSYHHVTLLSNGNLLAIKGHLRLMCLDWSSQLIWERKIAAHHDVVEASDGTIYVIIREPQIYRQMRVWFDAIIHLTPNGDEIDRWTTFEHLAELKQCLDTGPFLDTVLDSAFVGRPRTGPQATAIKKAIAQDQYGFDYFHLNTLSLIGENHLESNDGRFRRGNLLVCFRNVNQVAVLEKDTYRPLWAWGEGELQWPHHSTMLENGHILIFDNGSRRQYSRVIELEPVSKAIVWEYMTPSPEDFYSYARGSAQRLPNGNTLICESDQGQSFEVTPAGEMVWLWRNPATQDGRRLTVYRMIRLPYDTLELLSHRWWWLNTQ